MLGVGQIELIREKVFRKGWSIRRTAKTLGYSRNTVRRYLRGEAEPQRTEVSPRLRPVRDQISPVIEEILREWEPRTTKKQRPTGSRIHRELRERGFEVGLTSVRAVLRERRRQRLEVYVPLIHRPGDEAQVDFFEVTVEVNGKRRKAWKFLMRLMYSGRDYARIYDRQDQVAFLDGHVRAFEHFGAVPRRIVYDNLKAAVKKVLFPNRTLTVRFDALRRHFQFEPCFARPGEGHDKGGVESRGKGIRLQHLTPIPQAETLEEISEQLLADVVRQQERLGPKFTEDQAEMIELPAAVFDPRVVELVDVGRKCKVRVRKGTYSLPSEWRCLQATAYVGINEVEFACALGSVTRPRAPVGGNEIRYRDFLPELRRKPQAVRQVAPELVAELGEPYGRLWGLLCQTHGADKGCRTLAGVLAAVVDHGEEVVSKALEAALETKELLLMPEDRREGPQAPVRVPQALAHYEVEVASAADYDALLVASA